MRRLIASTHSAHLSVAYRVSFSRCAVLRRGFLNPIIEKETADSAKTKQRQRQEANSWWDSATDREKAQRKTEEAKVRARITTFCGVYRHTESLTSCRIAVQAWVRMHPVQGPDDWCDGLTAPSNEPVQWDPTNRIQFQCAEFDPPHSVPLGKRPPSWLDEYSYPSEHCGGRILDKWGYRWGQRIDELWLWAILPDGVLARDVVVEFHVSSLLIRFGGAVFHEGRLSNVDETEGLDLDSCAWVVVDLEQDEAPTNQSIDHSSSSTVTKTKVRALQLQLGKKKAFWWRAVWDGHPEIQPWEIPNWKSLTFENQ